MKNHLWGGLFCIAVAGLATGCYSVLPQTEVVTQSPWTNYTAVVTAFDKIVPYQTHVEDLKALGFHPLVSPNVKIMTYVEVAQYFMPNPSFTKADLNPSVRDCIQAEERCKGYLVDLSDIQTKRYGSAILDITGFKRRTHEYGWRFKGVILTTNGVVLYKLASGDPEVSTKRVHIKPLGPLQELDSAVGGAMMKAVH